MPLGQTTARFLVLFGGIWMFVGGVIAVIFTIAGGPVLHLPSQPKRNVAA